MSRFRVIPFFLVSLFIGWISLSGFANATVANATLEEQVIQIILDHPEVLIESVQAYQRRNDKRVSKPSSIFTTNDD